MRMRIYSYAAQWMEHASYRNGTGTNQQPDIGNSLVVERVSRLGSQLW